MSRKVHVANGRKAREQRQMVAKDSLEGKLLDNAAGQLKELDKRLGVGVGAVKERAKLARLVESGK